MIKLLKKYHSLFISDEDYDKKMKVMYNPESYSISYSNEFVEYKGINSSDTDINFQTTAPESLSFQLIFELGH